MVFRSKIIGVSAATALMLTTAGPALAALPMRVGVVDPAVKLPDSAADYGRPDRRRHGHRVAGDDILTGIGILTGIAILADVINSGEQRNRRDRAAESRNEPDPYTSVASGDIPTPQGDDIGVAVSACSRAAEDAARNNERVKAIDSVTRNGDSWQVMGQLGGANSISFNCQTSNGRVDSVKLSGSAV